MLPRKTGTFTAREEADGPTASSGEDFILGAGAGMAKDVEAETEVVAVANAAEMAIATDAATEEAAAAAATDEIILEAGARTRDEIWAGNDKEGAEAVEAAAVEAEATEVRSHENSNDEPREENSDVQENSCERTADGGEEQLRENEPREENSCERTADVQQPESIDCISSKVKSDLRSLLEDGLKDGLLERVFRKHSVVEEVSEEEAHSTCAASNEGPRQDREQQNLQKTVTFAKQREAYEAQAWKLRVRATATRIQALRENSPGFCQSHMVYN